MRKLFPLTLLLAASIVLNSCGGKRVQVKYDSGEKVFRNEKTDNSLGVEVVWVKNKSENVDLLLIVKNDYPHPIVIDEDGWHASFDDQKGEVKKLNFKTRFASEQAVKDLVIFGFYPPLPLKGTLKLKIDGIHSADRKKTYPPLEASLEIR